LNGLRAFEAAGRHLSFKQAAAELSVTPGAVGQQVKHLEEMLGVPLFQRLHRSLVLTTAGEALLPTVSEAFALLSAARDRVPRAPETRPLRLGVSPRLSADPEALLRRIAQTKRSPDYVRVSRSEDMTDLLNGGLDAILRPNIGPYPGMHAEIVALNPAFAPH